MVALGLCFRGKGTLHFVPKGERANSEHYLTMIKDVCEPDCHEHYGIPPGCGFQQGGESSHTSNVAQQYCMWGFPGILGREIPAGLIA